jgi:hypothetical protein
MLTMSGGLVSDTSANFVIGATYQLGRRKVEGRPKKIQII